MKTEDRRDRLIAAKAECLARMSAAGRQIYLEEVSPALPQRSEEIFRSCGYDHRPVPVETFISDPLYLGSSLKGTIYPVIVEDLIEIFEGEYVEICLSGSIGWGKSWEIVIGMAYEIYQLSCLENPARAFGLIPGSTLAFLNVSVDKRQARKILFNNLARIVHSSPYFRSVCPYRKNLRSEIFFPSKSIIGYPVAGTEQAILGEGVFSAAFDELNFMAAVERSKRSVPGETGLYDQAEVITNKLSARIRSRFNDRGRLPGHLWFASSSRYPNDFTERKEEESKKDASIFVRHRALWEAKPRHFFMPETFQVEVGDITRRTRVLDGSEKDVVGKVIHVPSDFHKVFLKDPDKAVRDLAGFSVLSVTPFIPRRECIRKMIELGTAAGLTHPFSKVDEQGRPLDVTLQDPNPETEVLLPERLHYIRRQKVDTLGRDMWEDPYHRIPVLESILFPALYFGHVDLARNRDAAGLVVGHAVGSKKCERMNEQTLQTVFETLPVIRVDLALRIIAPARGEIDITKIRALIHQLCNRVGMPFGLVTFDQYQSQEAIKSLKDAGITADTFSVDDSTLSYDMLKQALYDERILCYEFRKLEEELASLERFGHKIDHPSQSGSSKDISDCLAAVVHHVEEGWRRGAGSEGMFQFGIVDRAPTVLATDVVDRQARAFANVVAGRPYDEDDIFGI